MAPVPTSHRPRLRRPLLTSLSLAAALSLTACGGSDGKPAAPTGGSGGGGGGGASGGAPGTGGKDAGSTGGSGGADAASDGPAPGGKDAGADAGDSGGDGAADGGGLFAGCPGPEAYVGNPQWKNEVRVTGEASYCVNWIQQRPSLAAELAAKARLRITPGSYRLPETTAQAAFALPMCLLRTGQPVASGTGTVQFKTEEVQFIGKIISFDMKQPIAGGLLSGTLSAHGVTGDAYSLLIDGSGPKGESKTGDLTLSYCPPGGCSVQSTLYFEPCDFSLVRKEKVTFTGGNIELERHRGYAPGGIHDPVAFVRASGSFQGVAFDQREYFKLVFHAEHHLMNPKFAVFFDAPIAGACGLEIDFTGAILGTAPSAVQGYTIDCALNQIAPLAAATFVP